MFRALERFFLRGGDFCCTSRRADEGRAYPLDPPQLRIRYASTSTNIICGADMGGRCDELSESERH